MTDYIIRAYLPFDNQKLLSYYKSLEMMKIAINSNTGSEYNIKEEYNPHSDRLYHEIFRYVQEKISLPPKSLLMLPLDEKINIANRIAACTYVPNRQIAKFLHIPVKKSGPSTR